MRSSPDPFRVVTNDLGNGRDGLGELKMIGITVSWLGAGLNSVRKDSRITRMRKHRLSVMMSDDNSLGM